MAKSEGSRGGDESSLAPKKESPILRELKDQGTLLGGTVGLLGVIHLINVIGGDWLNRFGVIPRTLTGLKGILFSPFLHGSWGHLLSNSVPLLILGWMVMLRRKRDFFYVAGVSGAIGGIGTWLIGHEGVHIGASGVVFGLLGYLISRGVLERKFWSILAAVAATFLYGGALFGIFPTDRGISWEGHLFGLIGGIAAAYFMLKNAKQTAVSPQVPVTRARVAAAIDDEAPKPRLQTSATRVQEEEFESESELEKELAALRRRKAANR